jgi:hypothetical protein
MDIKKALKYIGVVYAIPVYVKKRIYESMAPHVGFCPDIVKKHAVSCVDLKPYTSHKWMCSMLMATETIPQFTI